MAYTKKTWEDFPNTSTPITADDLNNIEDGIEALDTAFSGLLNFFYPVGTIYETTSTNLDTIAKMATHFGGTWEVYGAGRVLVAKSADTEFDAVGKTGGAKTHTLTIDEMPSHTHPIGYLFPFASGGQSSFLQVTNTNTPTGISGDTIGNTGGGQAHNNLQPYIVVYRYRRTA